MKLLTLIRGKRRGVGGNGEVRGTVDDSANSTKKFPFVGKLLGKKSSTATAATTAAAAPSAHSGPATAWPADEAIPDFYEESDKDATFSDHSEEDKGNEAARGSHGSMQTTSQAHISFSGRLEPDSHYLSFQDWGSSANTPTGLKSDSRRLSFSGSLEPQTQLDTAGHQADSSKFDSQILTFSGQLDPDPLSAAIEAPQNHIPGRQSQRLSISRQLGPNQDYSGPWGGKTHIGSKIGSSEPLMPKQHSADVIGSGREGATATLSSRRLSFHEQLQELEPAAAELASISRRGGTGSLSSRQLGHGTGISQQQGKGTQIEKGGLLARSFRRLSISFQKSSQLQEREREQTREAEHDPGEFFESEVGRNSNAKGASRRWSFRRQAPQNDQEQEREVEQDPDEFLEGEKERSSNAKGASRRWSFRRQAAQKDQGEDREFEHDSDEFFEGEKGISSNASGTSRRWSFKRHALRKDQKEQSQQHEYAFSGPSITSGSASLKEGAVPTGSSRRLSSGSGASLKEEGARIGSSRRLSFKGGDELDQKGHSRRHSQLIAMWNPASNSATTIEASQGNSGQLWLKQASKRWREFGSARHSADVDPIEQGPERLQDWRVRILGIDPDQRWPVQGW